MNNYLELMQRVMCYGEPRKDRTGVGTSAVFSTKLKFDLSLGFPVVTTKKLYFKQVAAELACFLRAYRNLSEFKSVGCNIWDVNAQAEYWRPAQVGDLGRIYGVQWRQWRCIDADGNMSEIDQLKNAVNLLKNNPTSRRICVTAWNPGELSDMCLPPCHLYYQFYARNDGGLDCMVVMRSADIFLGMPFDIASYALLMRIVGSETGLVPRVLSIVFGDTHIYSNHIEQCKTQLAREPYLLPTLQLRDGVTIDDFKPEDATLVNYVHHDSIKAPMAL